MSLLKELNSAQKKAVETTSGNLLILAGPGTGKTKVIISKILYLIEQGLKPESILALTFSRKATREMQERLDLKDASLSQRVTVSTIHALCVEIVQKHGFRLGLQRRPQLMSEAQMQLFFRQVSNRLPLQPFLKTNNFEPVLQELLSFFSDCKDQGLWPEDVLRFASRLPHETEDEAKIQEEWLALGDVYNAYQSFCFEQGFLDFGDAILCSLRLLQDFAIVRQEIQAQWRAILVDEFQDTNWSQIQLLKLLSAPQTHVAVVGDDDQAIYRFRGASYSSFAFFEQAFEDVQTIELTDSFRLPPEVVTVSQTLIRANGDHRYRPDKLLKSKRKASGPVQVITCSNYEGEAKFLCDQIQSLIESGVSPGSIGILARAHAHAELFIAEAQRRKIPVEALGTQALFDQPIILDALCLLRLLNDPFDSVSFFRLFDSAFLRLPADEIYKFFHWSRLDQGACVDRLAKIEESLLTAESKARLTRFYQLYKDLFAKASRNLASELLLEVYESLEPIAYLYEQDASALKKLGEFHSQLVEWERNQPRRELRAILPLLEAFARHEITLNQEEGIERDPNKVAVLTVHSSKGLEFEHVFVISLVGRRFPSTFRSPSWVLPEGLGREAPATKESFLEEERRLFYVAITRAKHTLYLTTVEKRGTKPGLFLTEDLKPVLHDATLIAPRNIVEEQSSVEDKGQLPFSRIRRLTENSPKIRPKSLSLSFTQLDKYATCPLSYQLKYEFKIPVKMPVQVTVGSLVHTALEKFYQDIKKKKAPTKEALVKYFEEGFESEQKQNPDLTEDHRTLGKEKLEAYFDFQNGRFNSPFALEQDFSLKIGDHTIRGKIDRVDESAQGKKIIIDYKTGKAKSRENSEDRKFAENSLQLSIYALAAKEHFGWELEELILYYVYENTTLSATRTPAALDETKKSISEMAADIVGEKFPAKPGFHCSWCEYKMLCPIRPSFR